MADIAFLLLIFWLVATTLKYDKGFVEKVDSPDNTPKIAKVIDEGDVLRVKIDKNGSYLFNGNKIDYASLSKLVDIKLKRAGFKTRIILTINYDAPIKSELKVDDLVDLYNINITKNYEKKKLKTATED